MERAQQLLRESRMPIGQTASALGYADMFFFSKQFKQWFGVSLRKWSRLSGLNRRPSVYDTDALPLS